MSSPQDKQEKLPPTFGLKDVFTTINLMGGVLVGGRHPPVPDKHVSKIHGGVVCRRWLAARIIDTRGRL